jgi:hypothetical protein
MDKDVYKMLYAESSDGFFWTKPALESVPFGPYKATNIVFTGNGGWRRQAGVCRPYGSGQKPQI